MRITVTLDDLAALLRRARRLTKAGLEAIVNEALRRGLRVTTTPVVRDGVAGWYVAR